MNSAAAICGLGITEMGRVYRSEQSLAIDAVHLALVPAIARPFGYRATLDTLFGSVCC